MKRLYFWLPLTLVAVVFFAACGDDDDEDSDDTTPEESGDDADDDDAVDAGDLDSEVASQFESILEDLDTVRVEYDVLVGETSGEVTLFANAGDLRLDFRTDEGEGSVIVTQDASYFCAEELDDGEDVCIEFPGGEDIGDTGIPFGEIFTDLITGADEAGISIEDEEDQEVAGVEADCFLVTSEDIDGEALVCLSSENGVPLLVQGESDGEEFLLEAVEVSEEVEESDFEPPYPVEEFDLGDLDIDFEGDGSDDDSDDSSDDDDDATATAEETAGE